MKNNLKPFVTTSALAAIVFFLGITPYGIIPLGFINVTILCIPVIIGTLAVGLKAGVIIGACFGFSSTLRAFGIPSPASALVSNLVAENPILVILMSVIPRILLPFVVFYVNKLLGYHTHGGKNYSVTNLADSWIFVIASPIIFVALYAFKLIPFVAVIICFLCFACFELFFATANSKSRYILCSAAGSLTNTVFYLGLMLLFYTLCGIDSSAVLALIAGTGVIAGTLEAIAASVLCPPVIAALERAHLTIVTEKRK